MRIFNPYDYLKASPIFVFHHIPKCGGTSLVKILDKWFDLKKDYRIFEDYLKGQRGELESMQIRYSKPVALEKLRSYQCLVGHFEKDGNHIHQRYPEIFASPSRFKVFTFLRDPFAVKLSLYYWEKKMGRVKQSDLYEFMLYERQNYIASIFPCDISNFRAVLDQYFFIGIVESYQESVNILSRIIKKKSIRVPHLNKIIKDRISFDNDFHAQFKKNNEVDYALYDYALYKFTKSTDLLNQNAAT